MGDNLNHKEETVALVYEWLPHLYEVTERRYVAAESRIQQLLALSVTVFLGVVSLIGATQGQLAVITQAKWVIGITSAQVLIGMFSIAFGHFKVFGLSYIVNNALDYSAEEFKSNALRWADSDLHSNRTLTNRKGYVIWVMMVLFLAETGFLVSWLFGEFR